jgi:hypothetical protein
MSASTIIHYESILKKIFPIVLLLIAGRVLFLDK